MEDTSLSETCTHVLIKNLGHLARQASFQSYCGGNTDLTHPASLFCADQHYRFPLDHGAVQKMKDNCVPASFGKGNKEVFDDKYRRAFKLDLLPGDYGTNFDLDLVSTLATIEKLLMPLTTDRVVAKLDKINAYFPGGFFKAHQDTPRSCDMFGSLVVCLPNPFEGGELVVCDDAGEGFTTFAWGPDANDSKKLQWAAFFSDCKHEILEVKSGARVTATYNLFVEKWQPDFGHTDTPYSLELEKVLRNPGFMPDGGLLGFHCVHPYPCHKQYNKGSDDADRPPFLRGADAGIFAAAERLKLEPLLLPIWGSLGTTVNENGGGVQPTHPMTITEDCNEGEGEEYEEGEEDEEEGGRPVLGSDFDEATTLDYFPHNSSGELYAQVWKCLRAEIMPHAKVADKTIVWANEKLEWAESVALPEYGNEPDINYVYSAAAMILTVPPFDTRVLN